MRKKETKTSDSKSIFVSITLFYLQYSIIRTNTHSQRELVSEGMLNNWSISLMNVWLFNEKETIIWWERERERDRKVEIETKNNTCCLL